MRIDNVPLDASSHKHRLLEKGFTLAEMAIVLVIVVLLLGGLLVPLNAQIDQRNQSDASRELSEIRDALIGYAATHISTASKPYLPCPDINNDGREDRTGTACTNVEGNVPWADLGLAQVDPWNNRFRYRVDAAFANSSAGFDLNSTPGLRICDAAGCSGNIIANNLPAVFLSHGKDGAGAVNSSGGVNAAPSAAQSDELENTNANAGFVMHPETAAAAPGGAFDDLVAWLPTSILMSRMIAAGRLP